MEAESTPIKRGNIHAFRRALSIGVSATLFAGAVLFLSYTLRKYQLEHVLLSVRSVAAWKVFAACVFCGLSYLALTLYDILGLRHMQHPLPLKHAMLVSFVAHAFSNNVGATVLSGGSLRFRMYSAFGMEVGDILRLIAFCNLTFLIGFAAIGGATLALLPLTGNPLPFGSLAMQLAGFGLVLLTLIYLLAAKRRGAIRAYGYTIELPSIGISMAQILAASLDWILTALIFFVLLPAGHVSFILFVGIFLTAHVAGILSSVPAGLGVFEAMLLFLLSSSVPAPAILGAIVLYRTIYYLLPLAVSVTLFIIHEFRSGLPGRTSLAR